MAWRRRFGPYMPNVVWALERNRATIVVRERRSILRFLFSAREGRLCCKRARRFNVLLTINKLFPLILLVCNAGAAVCYAVAGDYRRSVYWVASAVCIAAISF